MRSVSSSSPNDLHQQANQWADQAQREKEKIRLYGELELRNGRFRESQAKDCQEIEELRREFVAKKQIEQDKQ